MSVNHRVCAVLCSVRCFFRRQFGRRRAGSQPGSPPVGERYGNDTSTRGSPGQPEQLGQLDSLLRAVASTCLCRMRSRWRWKTTWTLSCNATGRAWPIPTFCAPGRKQHSRCFNRDLRRRPGAAAPWALLYRHRRGHAESGAHRDIQLQPFAPDHPQTSSFVTGTSSLVAENTQANFGLQKGSDGTNVSFGWNNTLANSNSGRSDFNPSKSANFNLTVTRNCWRASAGRKQPLHPRSEEQLKVSDLVFNTSHGHGRTSSTCTLTW